jgi:hypothetical protein
MEQVFKWHKERFKTCNLEAIQHAFTNVDTKDKLGKIILTAYEQ